MVLNKACGHLYPYIIYRSQTFTWFSGLKVKKHPLNMLKINNICSGMDYLVHKELVTYRKPDTFTFVPVKIMTFRHMAPCSCVADKKLL
jgi:hypothetical protein